MDQLLCASLLKIIYRETRNNNRVNAALFSCVRSMSPVVIRGLIFSFGQKAFNATHVRPCALLFILIDGIFT